MFKVGDTILYTTYGVCTIKDLTTMLFNGANNEYYVLVPINESKTELTIPVNNPIVTSRLHPLLSKAEIEGIIKNIPEIETYWIDNDNERKKEFSDKIKLGDRKNTISIIKSIKKHQLSLIGKNRKLHSVDEQVMRDAEKLIFEEFSYVLDKPRCELISKVDELIYDSIK